MRAPTGPKSNLAIGGAHDRAASRYRGKRATASIASTTRAISIKVLAGINAGMLENNVVGIVPFRQIRADFRNLIKSGQFARSPRALQRTGKHAAERHNAEPFG